MKLPSETSPLLWQPRPCRSSDECRGTIAGMAPKLLSQHCATMGALPMVVLVESVMHVMSGKRLPPPSSATTGVQNVGAEVGE